MRKTALLTVIFCFLATPAFSEELTVRLNCKNGKCVPVTPAPKASPVVDVGALKSAAAKLAAAKKALEDVKIGKGRIDQAYDKLLKLEDAMKDLKGTLADLNKRLGSQQDKKELEQLEAEDRMLEDAISKLLIKNGLQDLKVEKLQAELAKTNALLHARRTNLELSPYGLLAYNFGAVGGLHLSVSLPMGDEGLWLANLGGGLGVTDTVGVGWIADLSFLRKLNSHLALGPAFLAAGNEGDLTNGSKWLLGGGLELKLNTKMFFASLMPFVGVTTGKNTIGVWHAAEGKQTPCGWLQTREPWFEPQGQTKETKLTVGGLLKLGILLF